MTRAFAVPGLLLLLSLAAVFKPGHWRETAARRRRAGGVQWRVPKRRLQSSSSMRVRRVRWPGLLAGGALGLAGAQTSPHPLADPGILASSASCHWYWARRCLVSPRRWNSFHT